MYFIFCMCDVLGQLDRACTCLRISEKQRKRREWNVKARLEEGAEGARGSVNTFRVGLGDCFLWGCRATVALFAITVRERLPACYSVIQTAELLKLQIRNAHCNSRHSCTGIHVHTHGCSTSAFTASLGCDRKGRDSFLDKKGIAFKVGALSLFVSAKTYLFRHTAVYVPFFRLYDTVAFLHPKTQYNTMLCMLLCFLEM